MAESEAETPSTPGEFESKYFEFHGVRLPPFCRGKMEEIANFPVRPSDVWIVTYPKSGEPRPPGAAAPAGLLRARQGLPVGGEEGGGRVVALALVPLVRPVSRTQRGGVWGGRPALEKPRSDCCGGEPGA